MQEKHLIDIFRTLHSEMILLSLFSDLFLSLEKEKMAQKLLLLKPQAPVTSPLSRYGTAYGKPSFPSDVCQSTKLCDLISQDSWFFFQILQIDTGFFCEKAATWPNNDSYQLGLENIDAINVANDCAKRVVKLSTY